MNLDASVNSNFCSEFCLGGTVVIIKLDLNKTPSTVPALLSLTLISVLISFPFPIQKIELAVTTTSACN